MSLREDMWKYEQITGKSAEHVPLMKLGAFLDGYEMGIEASEQTDVLDKIREEIERLNPVDYGSIYSYESHNGAKYMKDDVLDIIDKYKVESEDKE